MAFRRSSLLAFGFMLYAASTLISMAAMSMGVFFLLLVMIVYFRSPRNLFEALGQEWQEQASTRFYVFISLGLAAACALSLAVAWMYPLGYAGRTIEVYFVKDMAKAWYLFLPWILVVGLRQLEDRDRRNILRVWILVFAVFSVLGMLQYFWGWPRHQMIPGNEPRYHVVLFLGHHLSVASIFIFPLFAVLDLARRSDGLKICGLSQNFLATSALLGVIALLGTYSRALWIALPLGLLIWAVWVLPKKTAVVTFILIAIAVAGASQLPAVQKRLNDSLGVGTRQELWRANMEFLKARPLTGTGWHHNLELSGYYFQSLNPGVTEGFFVGHAHNNFIEMLGSTGFIGALAWLAWSFGVIGLAWRSSRASEMTFPFARGLVCAWLVFYINGLTQVNFWESKVLHQIMWVVAWTLFFATPKVVPLAKADGNAQ